MGVFMSRWGMGLWVFLVWGIIGVGRVGRMWQGDFMWRGSWDNLYDLRMEIRVVAGGEVLENYLMLSYLWNRFFGGNPMDR